MGDLRMPDINEVRIAGRLTRDPELKYTASGDAYCKLGIAYSKKYKTKAGEMREDTVFIDGTCWRGTAEWVGTHMKRSYPIIANAELTMNEWQDAQTGQKRSKIELKIQRVQQLDWDNNNASPDGGKPKPREIEEPEAAEELPF